LLSRFKEQNQVVTFGDIFVMFQIDLYRTQFGGCCLRWKKKSLVLEPILKFQHRFSCSCYSCKC